MGEMGPPYGEMGGIVERWRYKLEDHSIQITKIKVMFLFIVRSWRCDSVSFLSTQKLLTDVELKDVKILQHHLLI